MKSLLEYITEDIPKRSKDIHKEDISKSDKDIPKIDKDTNKEDMAEIDKEIDKDIHKEDIINSENKVNENKINNFKSAVSSIGFKKQKFIDFKNEIISRIYYRSNI